MDQKSFARDDFSAFSKLEARKNPRAKKKVTSRRSRASLYISGSSEFLRPAFDFCHFGVVCSCWFGILGLGILAILTLVAVVLVWD